MTKRRAYDATYNAAHREERRAYGRAYYATHLAERRAYDAKHIGKKRAYRRAYGTAYRATHLDERRAYDRAYDAKHREERRAYRAAHLAERRDQAHRRRAKKREKTSEPITRGFLALLFDAQAHVCWYCPAPLVWSAKPREPGHKHLEHKTPLARINGVHAPWNLCWSCASCNLRKHAMTEAEFLGPGDLYQDWPEPDGP